MPDPFAQLPIDPDSPDATQGPLSPLDLGVPPSLAQALGTPSTPAVPPLPILVPPNVTQSPNQRLLQIAALGAALGAGPRSGIGVGGIHGLLTGEGQLQQALNQRAELAQAVAEKQHAEFLRMQQQAMTDARLQNTELLNKLQVLRQRVDELPNKAAYDEEIRGWANALKMAGYRDSVANESWLRQAVPFTAAKAKKDAKASVEAWWKSPHTQDLLKAQPDQLLKGTLPLDVDGTGTKQPVPIPRAMDLAGILITTGPNGQPMMAPAGTTVEMKANADGIYQDLLKIAASEGKDINSPRVTAALRAQALRQAHEATKEPTAEDNGQRAAQDAAFSAILQKTPPEYLTQMAKRLRSVGLEPSVVFADARQKIMTVGRQVLPGGAERIDQTPEQLFEAGRQALLGQFAATGDASTPPPPPAVPHASSSRGTIPAMRPDLRQEARRVLSDARTNAGDARPVSDTDIDTLLSKPGNAQLLEQQLRGRK